MKAEIKIFEERKVRTMWNEDTEEWYFSIVDVVGILTDQPTIDSARNYWKVLKHRMKAEGNETVTNCNQLKLLGQDGKMRMTDVANETYSVLFNLSHRQRQSLSNNGWHKLQNNGSTRYKTPNYPLNKRCVII